MGRDDSVRWKEGGGSRKPEGGKEGDGPTTEERDEDMLQIELLKTERLHTSVITENYWQVVGVTSRG